MTSDPFWQDRWHWCALAAGFLAASEGRLDDSSYVKELAYGMYESGAFAARAQPSPPAAPRNSTVCLTGAARGACCDATQGSHGGPTTKESEVSIEDERTKTPVNAGRRRIW